jgi:hypothetical protein
MNPTLDGVVWWQRRRSANGRCSIVGKSLNGKRAIRTNRPWCFGCGGDDRQLHLLIAGRPGRMTENVARINACGNCFILVLQSKTGWRWRANLNRNDAATRVLLAWSRMLTRTAHTPQKSGWLEFAESGEKD